MKMLEGRAAGMEKPSKEIQMETAGQSEIHSAAQLCPSTEEQEEKLTMFCFKKKKKSCKKGLETKGGCEEESATLITTSQCISAADGEGGVSDKSQSPKGTWATIKHLVALKRRSKSSRKQTHSDSQVQLETHAEDTDLQSFPKNRISSGLKIPCIRFSKDKKKSSHSEITEESKCNVKANEVMGMLNKANGEPEDLAVKASTDQCINQVSEKSTDNRNSLNSPEKNVLLGEPRPDNNQHTQCLVQAEITNSEVVAVMLQEKLHQKSPQETPEHTLTTNEGVDLTTAFSANVSKDLAEIADARETNNINERGLEWKEAGKSINASKGSESRETVMSFSQSAFKGDVVSVQACSNEQWKLEENKATNGVGIIITVTEAEEPEEEQSDHVCGQSSVSSEHKQKGIKKISENANFSKPSNRKEGSVTGSGHRNEVNQVSSALARKDQEHRTSEQHELLLIETAASLVKAAIQSSIEQLLNEMALDHNKHNSFL